MNKQEEKRMSETSKIDFLYLSEKDMIEAGVLDGKRCVDTMSEVMELLSREDYLLGGPTSNSGSPRNLNIKTCQRTAWIGDLWPCRHIWAGATIL